MSPPRSRRCFLRLLALLALSSLLLTTCGRQTEQPSERRADNTVPLVEALPARLGTLPLSERLSGIVKARNQVAIRPEISARVVEILVENGDAVKRGDPLVRLDDARLSEQLRRAEANVQLSEAATRQAKARVDELTAQVRRSRQLAAEKLISELELETQEAQLAAAEANSEETLARLEEARAAVDEQRAMLVRTVIRAPISGRVGQRNAEIGMLVDPGTVLFQIGDLDHLIVEVPLTERMLGHVATGQPVAIQGDALTAPLEASLSRISPFLRAGSFSTLGEIDVENPNGRLRSGMFLTVDVMYGESDPATLVPASALWDDPLSGQRGVFVIDALRSADPTSREELPEPLAVELRPVRILADGRGTVGLLGVEPGEWVVVVGQHLLSADAEARVRPTTWERVLELQDLQREDVLAGFLSKQRRLAQERGTEPPSTAEYIAPAPGRKPVDDAGETSGARKGG